MKIFPGIRSVIWFKVMVIAGFTNYFLFILSRVIVGATLDFRVFFSFLILSLVVAICYLVGYFGARIWVYTYAVANLIALGYLMYSVTFNVADGWTDLASFIGTLFWLVAGFVIGGVLQLGMFLYRRFISR